jgi:hypothetical protein
MTTQDGPEKNARIILFTVALYTTEFNPEKYYALSSLLADIYRKTNNPALLLNCFLDVMTTTKNESKDETGAIIGSFNGSDYNNNNHLLASSLLDVIKPFESNAWMIWIGLLMKKRIVIYSDSLTNLLKFIRALPLFVIHRQDWSLLRPFVTLENESEIADLKTTGVFVAGFLSPKIKTKEDLYDMFIDLTNFDITVPTHAEDDFTQTPFHQDCAKLLTTANETEGINDQKLIKAVKAKTAELISKLNQLKTQNKDDDKPYVSYSSLANRGLNPAIEKFLYSVASAEGMTKIG